MICPESGIGFNDNLNKYKYKWKFRTNTKPFYNSIITKYYIYENVILRRCNSNCFKYSTKSLDYFLISEFNSSNNDNGLDIQITEKI